MATKTARVAVVTTPNAAPRPNAAAVRADTNPDASAPTMTPAPAIRIPGIRISPIALLLYIAGVLWEVNPKRLLASGRERARPRLRAHAGRAAAPAAPQARS